MKTLIALLLLTTAAHAAGRSLPPQLILPPVEFDKPYTGPLVELRVDSAEDLKIKCNNPFSPPAIPLACAFPMTQSCVIILVSDDAIRAAGYEPDHVRRHEIGHCNGWSKTHPNPRWTK